MDKWKDLHFGYKEIGSMVLAYSKEDWTTLEALKLNGEKNGLDDLRFLTQEEVRHMEPHINDAVIGALYCPTVGIASPYELVIALAENALANGVDLMLDAQVCSIDKVINEETYAYNIHTESKTYQTHYIINAAGVYSDKVAKMVGADDFTIMPRRGEYVLLNKNQGHLAKTVLFQCPTDKGKGILVTSTYHGNLMLGPNTQEIDDPDDVSTSKEILDYIVDTARKTIPDFDIRQTLTSFSGIRATSNRHDFIIEESSVKGFINVAGIESPGLTSSPAIAKHVVAILGDMGLVLTENTLFNPHRAPIIVPKDDLFAGDIHSKNPETHIICRCEGVTEAEIIDALNRGIDINSTDSIKRRTRAGMGPCQGSFCATRVAEVIAKSKGMAIEDVPRRGKGSSILPDREDRFFYKK